MAKTKFRPLHDRVVVRRITALEKTKGGIIIPDSAQEKPSEGEVIAVGPGGRDEAAARPRASAHCRCRRGQCLRRRARSGTRPPLLLSRVAAQGSSA